MEKIIDVTGAVLMPGYPDICQGNGEDPRFEICCDECEYLRVCLDAEKEQRERREAWEFAHGMSNVDGKKISPEMAEMIEREIRGEISTADIKKRLDEKYAALAKEE